MKKISIRLLCLALMLMMVLPAVSMAETSEPVLLPYSEPISLSVLQIDITSYDRDSTKEDRKSLEDNAWIDAYLSELNIKAERMTVPDTDSLNSMLNTMMASNDLPDVIVASREMYFFMAENGVLGDLSAAYKDAMQTLPYFAETANTFSQEEMEYCTYEGELLGFPLLQPVQGVEDTLWIRQDWLDAVNLPVPKNIDEMIAVAEAFVKAGLGGEQGYGLGLVGGTNNLLDDFITGFGIVPGTWEKQADGQYKYTNTLVERMKEPLLKLQKMHADGLLKSDFAATATASNSVDSDLANGVIGMAYAPCWYGATAIGSNFVNDEKADWIAIPLPSVSGEIPHQKTGMSVDPIIMISAECEHPEAIFKMLNLETYVKSYDLERKYFNTLYRTDDEYEIWDLKIFRNFDRGNNGFVEYNTVREALKAYEAGETVDTSVMSGTVLNLYTAGVKAREGSRADAGLNSVIDHGNLAINMVRDAGCLDAYPYYGPVTENFSLFSNTINEALNKAMYQVVMGADISVYEKAVEAWYANGGQAITDDINSYYALSAK